MFLNYVIFHISLVNNIIFINIFSYLKDVVQFGNKKDLETRKHET
jgi:hypothetical protein